MIKTCIICGAKFEAAYAWQKYCSPECRNFAASWRVKKLLPTQVKTCIICGKEFETKNPKRVICPDCLYSDKKYTEELSNEAAKAVSNSDDSAPRNSYSFGESQNERPLRN